MQRTTRFAFVVANLSFAVSTAAFAGPPAALRPVHFDIPRQAASKAIIQVAVQGHISLGGADPRLCDGAAVVQLLGVMAPGDALRLVLRGTGCTVRQADTVTFVLQAPAQRMGRPKAMDTEPRTEITVTGSRRPLFLGASPANVSVISSADLRTGGTSLNAIADGVPGFTVTNLGPGRDKIMLRGVSDGIFTGRTQSTVGLYLDDTPITFNAPDPDLLLTDIARIEVLKGPQGALYGEGSIAGVVRIVTAKPDHSRFATAVLGEAATAGRGAGGGIVSGMLNLPIVPGRLAVRGVAYSESLGGYIDDQGIGISNANGTARYGGRLAAIWDITPVWELFASGTVQEINSKNSQYVTGSSRGFVRQLHLREPHDNDFSDAAVGLEGHLRMGTVKVAVNHLHHRLQSDYDASSAANLFSVPGRVVGYHEDQRIELNTVEATLVSPANRHFRWLAGIFTNSSSDDLRPRLLETAANAVIYDEHRHDRINTIAGFAEASADLGTRWTVTVGYRATQTRRQTLADAFEAAATAATNRSFSDSVESHKRSGKVLVSYVPWRNWLIYALYAEGFRDGGFNTTVLSLPVNVPATYNGDDLTSFETGLRGTLFDGKLRMSMSRFKVWWRDIQSDQLQANGLPFTVNIGSGFNAGVELEADWAVSDNLKLHGAWMLNDPQLTSPNPLYATDEDAGLPFIPREGLSLAATWSGALGGHPWSSTADVSYHGKSYLNFGSLQTVGMGGYTMINLSSTVSVGAFDYRIRLENASNVRDNSFAYGNPFSLAREPQFTPPRPATLWLSVGYRY